MPESPFRVGWDMFMLVLIVYYAVSVPLTVGFNRDPFNEVLELILNLFFRLGAASVLSVAVLVHLAAELSLICGLRGTCKPLALLVEATRVDDGVGSR